MKIRAKLLGCSAFVIQAVFATELENEDAADCEPCCVPTPRKCIDCVCYTAPYYKLQCDLGVSVSGEFLYWYARENNIVAALEYTTVDSGIELTSLIPTDFRFICCPSSAITFEGNWDPGYRVGLSLNSDRDGWDYGCFLTRYKNTSRTEQAFENWIGEVPPIGGKMLFDPLAPIYGVSDLLGFQSMKGIWEFSYNNVDLVMGRRYFLSECFAMRPFLGVRGTWTNTHLKVSFSRDISQINFVALSEFVSDFVKHDFGNSAWGVGIVTGIQPTFFFTPCLSLFGELGGSLVWGKLSYKSRFKRFSEFGNVADNLETLYNFTCKEKRDRPSSMQFQLDLAIGLRWEDTYCCDRFSFGLDAGWEHHLLPQHTLRLVTDAGPNVTTNVDPNDIRGTFNTQPHTFLGSIGFGGLVLRARLGF